jgi:hypothetical protein
MHPKKSLCSFLHRLFFVDKMKVYRSTISFEVTLPAGCFSRTK